MNLKVVFNDNPYKLGEILWEILDENNKVIEHQPKHLSFTCYMRGISSCMGWAISDYKSDFNELKEVFPKEKVFTFELINNVKYDRTAEENFKIALKNNKPLLYENK